MFACDKCSKTFANKFNLRRHLSGVHRCELPSLKRGRTAHCANSVDEGNRKGRQCATCKLWFSCRQSLYKHRRSKHTILNTTLRRPPTSSLEKFEFSSVAEFYSWKTQMEQATTSSFVKCRKDCRFGGSIRRTYRCHRSGFIRQRGQGKRHIKVQGSCKSGARCPAAIYVRISQSGCVNVTFYPDHQGHKCDVAHQQLTRDQRAEIAGLLKMGITFDDILDRVQASGNNQTVTRLHFTSKQDLKNIIRDFNLTRGITYSANDADSVAAWVEHNRLDGERCMVRYVKFQGECDEVRGLAADDFMLIIMSECQIATLQQLYQPLKEVAMDSTHGTNGYDYQLTTVMLIDEHGEGYPAAFCFSNRVTESTMEVFLSVCRECSGLQMSDAVLMTDDTEVFHKAWSAVMGKPAHRLLCSWHVDRSWRKNLYRIQGDNVLKASIYKTLRALMDIRDKEIFDCKLVQFLETAAADDKLQSFAAYFEKEYGSRPQLWALCHRLGLHTHHNMHLEAMHRALKHVHMDGRKVKRMDKCIHALLRLLRSKTNDRLRKIHKGKWTTHLLGIRNRHRKGVQCKESLVTVIEPNRSYAVQGSNQTDVYVVEQSDTVPHSTQLCPLQCEVCGICVHTFMCNCVDAGLRTTICKHIHLVVHACSPSISCTPDSTQANKQCDGVDDNGDWSIARNDDMENDTVEHEEAVQACRSVEMDETEEILDQFRVCESQDCDGIQRNAEIAEQHWAVIRGKLNQSAEIAAGVRQQMARIRSWITAVESKNELPEPKYPMQPANKKISPQRRHHYFASTKKTIRKRKAEERLSKPDVREKAYLLEALSVSVETISSTRVGTDHDYDAHPADVVAFEHTY